MSCMLALLHRSKNTPSMDSGQTNSWREGILETGIEACCGSAKMFSRKKTGIQGGG